MNIIISGCTCSGKTTLSRKIESKLSPELKVTHIEEDWYFKNLCDIPRSRAGYMMESPNAFYSEEFIKDVNELLNSGVVLMPRYDIASNTRLSKDMIVTKGDINVIEGLHTIDLLKDLRDSIKIFINTDINECLSRRIIRDKEYGISEAMVRSHFLEIILPLYKVYIESQKQLADVIIEKEEDTECLLKKLKKY